MGKKWFAKRMTGGNRELPSKTRDMSALKPRPTDAEMVLLGKLLSRARYRGWTWFSVVLDGGFGFAAFVPDPAEPARLKKLGPWPLPEDAGPDEVMAAALAAVVATDGESARAEFRYREG